MGHDLAMARLDLNRNLRLACLPTLLNLLTVFWRFNCLLAIATD
ncbi:hypothetical protein ACOKW7_22190 [Limnospira platensis CENA597]